MKFVDSIYKIKSLYRYGLFLFVAIITMMLLGWLLIPRFSVNTFHRQLITLPGKHIKYNDNVYVSHFLNSIKANNGYLCLGTSESGTLNGGNYYDFLNNGTAFNCRFSILCGAGRTCGIYIPMLLNHKNEVDSLKIIYFINPVYWGENLCQVSQTYWERYNSYAVCKNIDLSEPEYEKNFKQIIDPYFNKLNLGQKLVFTVEYWLRQARKAYFQDLRCLLSPVAYEESISYVNTQKSALSSFYMFGDPDLASIDTIWNIKNTFQHKDWFRPINEEVNYRYIELTAFITLCRDLKIDAVYIIGPFNKRFIENHDPKSLSNYTKTSQKIKDILSRENAQFIDASDISSTLGVFIDHQHYSSFGAYLIYKKIRSYIHEKENN